MSVALTKCIKDDNFVECASVFTDVAASHKDIEEAGEKAMLIVYNGGNSKLDDLDTSCTAAKLQQVRKFWILRHCLQLPMQQNTIYSGFFAKCRSGRESHVTQPFADGNLSKEDWLQYKMLKMQKLPQRNC